jgi:TPR repeat protein
MQGLQQAPQFVLIRNACCLKICRAPGVVLSDSIAADRRSLLAKASRGLLVCETHESGISIICSISRHLVCSGAGEMVRCHRADLIRAPFTRSPSVCATGRNNARDQYEYAHCLETGRGAVTDLIGAAEHYRLTAARHFAPAQHQYAVCLQSGRGVAVDLIEAAKYYRLAADHNYAVTAFNYGFCLETGSGVSADLTQAARYYKRAADQNYAPAQHNYGYCLENGSGTTSVDLIAAAKYYTLAADQNCPPAQKNYGVCLQNGVGVAVDLNNAARY